MNTYDMFPVRFQVLMFKIGLMTELKAFVSLYFKSYFTNWARARFFNISLQEATVIKVTVKRYLRYAYIIGMGWPLSSQNPLTVPFIYARSRVSALKLKFWWLGHTTFKCSPVKTKF